MTAVSTFCRMMTVVFCPGRKEYCQVINKRLSSSLPMTLSPLQQHLHRHRHHQQQTRSDNHYCHRVRTPRRSLAFTLLLDWNDNISTKISIWSSRNISFSSLANQQQQHNDKDTDESDDDDNNDDKDSDQLSPEDRWDQLFQRLLVYRQHHNGSTLVPQSYKSDPELGRWVKRQRYLYKQGKLPQHRFLSLEACGFWWDAREGTWQEQFQKLIEYKTTHDGSTLVPKRYHDAELAHWVGTQRKFRKEGRLAHDRIDRLDAIDFVWDPLEEAWETMLEEWKIYFGAKKQARDKTKGGGGVIITMSPKLADWVDVQRMYYVQNRLPDHRRERLLDAGLVLQPREESWWYMYDKLKAYVDQHGDALIPYDYPHDPALGRWVHTQRGTRRRRSRSQPRTMPQRRIDALDELGFVWEVRSGGGSGNHEKEEEDPSQ